MKKKITLDIIMTIIMVGLLNTNIIGLALHELLGIGVFFLFLFHKILNFKWIKTVTVNLLTKSVNPKTKLLYAIDVLLLLLATLNVGSGILISTYVLTDISAGDIFLTSQLHHIFAYLLGITLIVHIGLHWAFIRNALKIPKGSLVEKLVLGAIAIILAVVLLESNTIKNYLPPRKDPDSGYQTETEEPMTQEPTDPSTSAPPDDTEPEPEDPTESTEPDPTEPDETEPDPTEPTEPDPTESEPTEPDPTEPEPTEPEPSTPAETLQEYLSKLRCTGCGRRCVLTSPGCSRGRNQQQQAVQEYNETYNTSETYGNSGNGDQGSQGS